MNGYKRIGMLAALVVSLYFSREACAQCNVPQQQQVSQAQLLQQLAAIQAAQTQQVSVQQPQPGLQARSFSVPPQFVSAIQPQGDRLSDRFVVQQATQSGIDHLRMLADQMKTETRVQAQPLFAPPQTFQAQPFQTVQFAAPATSATATASVPAPTLPVLGADLTTVNKVAGGGCGRCGRRTLLPRRSVSRSVAVSVQRS